MKAIELSLPGHLWPVAAIALTCWIAAHGGKLGATPLMNAHFDAKRFPVQAVDYLEKQESKGTSSWSRLLGRVLDLPALSPGANGGRRPPRFLRGRISKVLLEDDARGTGLGRLSFTARGSLRGGSQGFRIGQHSCRNSRLAADLQ